jgi:tRNA1(Val) A37 N6-methylase TrmN6
VFEKWSKVKENGGFDSIVCNPPYNASKNTEKNNGSSTGSVLYIKFT